MRSERSLTVLAGPRGDPQGAVPNTIIYLKDGSCAGVNRIAGNGQIAANTTMFYIPPDQDPAKASPTCTQVAAQVGDVVLADADATLCPGVSAQPTGTKDFQGPVNNMVMVVPSSSTDGAGSPPFAHAATRAAHLSSAASS